MYSTSRVDSLSLFSGLFLTDLVFSEDGNPEFRNEGRLINFDKYNRIARIISEVQRFQAPYNLVEVREIQEWIRSLVDGAGQKNVEDFYRMSLLLEPREAGTVDDDPLKLLNRRRATLEGGLQTAISRLNSSKSLDDLSQY